jgi:hypothetical protein
MKRAVFLAVLAIFAGSCATVQVPWQEQLKSYPVIDFGQPPPADGKYVVRIPAGKPSVVMKVIFQGDIFAHDTMQEVSVTPKRDIYLYESWVSFDMETWAKTRSALTRKWDFKSPDYKNPEAGHLKIILNERQE